MSALDEVPAGAWYRIAEDVSEALRVGGMESYSAHEVYLCAVKVQAGEITFDTLVRIARTYGIELGHTDG